MLHNSVTFNTVENIAYCEAYVRDVTSLILYTHIPVAAFALLFGLFVIWYGKNKASTHTFFYLLLFFSLWIMLDLIIWFSYARSSYLMLAWSLIELVSLFMFFYSWLFVYSLRTGHAPSRRALLLALLPLLPVAALSATSYNLLNFDATECVAVENASFGIFILLLKALYVLLILREITLDLREVGSKHKLQPLLVVTFLLFLVVHTGAGFLGGLLDNYKLESYSLLLLLIFLAIVTYQVISGKLFEVKVAAVHLLVIILVLLILAQFLFIRNPTNKILTGFTAFIATIFGAFLIRTYTREQEIRRQGEQLARYLANANARLRELDRAKTEFVSLASHQLRGPITAMQGYASIMLEGTYGAVPEYFKTPLTRVFESSRHLAIMVDDFLNVTRIEQGRMKYAQDRINFDKLAHTTVEELQVMGREKGLIFSYEQLGDLPCEVIGDEGKLKQVISNIIDNAIKYTKAGSIQITVTGSREKNTVELAVKDTGVGIPIEDQQQLFQKFARASNANTSNVYGTGLGLYVVKEMVKAHGGMVDLTSPGAGAGTTFIVTLPMAPPSEHHKARTFDI